MTSRAPSNRPTSATSRRSTTARRPTSRLARRRCVASWRPNAAPRPRRSPRPCAGRDRQLAAGPRDQPSMPDHPDFRLTVRRGAVLAIDWSPWLATGGPLMTMLHARGRAGVGIADVCVLREDDVATEAIVRFLAGDTE